MSHHASHQQHPSPQMAPTSNASPRMQPHPQQQQPRQPGPPVPSGAGAVWVSPEHHAAIHTTLQVIQQKMNDNVKHIDESLQTPYPIDTARADYHAMLALLSTLEHQIQPISLVGYDPAILTKFTAEPPPPLQPNALDAIVRFREDLSAMNVQMKLDSMHLSNAIGQTTGQTKTALKEWKAGMDKMRYGEVTVAAESSTASAATVPPTQPPSSQPPQAHPQPGIASNFNPQHLQYQQQQLTPQQQQQLQQRTR